jgi:Mycobacterium membrane protein
MRSTFAGTMTMSALCLATLVGCGGAATKQPASSPEVTAAESTPAESSQVPQQAPKETASGAVLFEAFGTGGAYSVDTVPAEGQRVIDVALPYSKTITIGSDVKQLQVVVVGKDTPGPGCRITLNGKIVAEEPVGGSAHCTYTMPA